MPKPKFQQSFDVLDDTPNFKLDEGRYIDLRFVLKGTLKTGETLDITQVGDIFITRNGDPMQNAPVEYYHQVNSEWNAPPDFTNVEGGEVRLVWYVPFYLPEIPSSTPFAANRGQVRVNLPNGEGQHLTNVLDSGRLRVTARTADVPSRYLLNVAPKEETFSGSFTGEPEEYSEPNIVRMWFEDEDDAVTQVTITQDGRNLVEAQTLAELDDDDTHDNQNFAPTALTEYNPIDGGGNLRSRRTTVRMSGQAESGGSKVKTTRMYLTELDL